MPSLPRIKGLHDGTQCGAFQPERRVVHPKVWRNLRVRDFLSHAGLIPSSCVASASLSDAGVNPRVLCRCFPPHGEHFSLLFNTLLILMIVSRRRRMPDIHEGLSGTRDLREWSLTATCWFTA